ncbi:MAG: hypothetical protein AB9866_22745 [Syntrophobacteraceae bacterium]
MLARATPSRIAIRAVMARIPTLLFLVQVTKLSISTPASSAVALNLAVSMPRVIPPKIPYRL